MKTNHIIAVCLSLMGASGSFAAKNGTNNTKQAVQPHTPQKETVKPLTPEEQFDKMDVNHDDKLNHAEFLPHHKDIVKAKKEFEAMDTDKDGFVSRKEFLAHHHKK